ncbi:VTT domain-containing protein [Solibacillus sp. FSL H8-0538]|uniref:VTT domain-containing protein n=1 Tax=Solibacillus sp. FSL H8-0538 TaxID=2921400 RepID=UPI0030F9D88A
MEQIDVALQNFLDEYGLYIYSLLFLIIFLKTAFVVLTFLPGDVIVFVSGALVAMGELNLFILFPLLVVATILGDCQNYYIGKIGRKLNKKSFLIPKATLERARQFINHQGHNAILFARFVPFMRTTIPFISGYTNYTFRTFLLFNTIGALFWVILWLMAGLLLGKLPIIEEHMTVSLALISCIPFLVPIVLFIRKKMRKVTS